jgi:hypothetical protein
MQDRDRAWPGRLAKRRRKEEAKTSYRAITLGSEREDWGVVDDNGELVWRGDAKVAAMIASRLTKPGA